MKYLNKLIKILAQYEVEGYLVGGFVRDYLLARETQDIDLVISKQVRTVAKKFAVKTNGSFVVLDELHDIYRVVIEDLIYDFAPIMGASIEDDLFKRDFTINALAIPLTDIKDFENEQKINNLIDPTGGQKDLKEGIIRAVSKDTFKDDPLRLYRAIRFKAELNFVIASQTESLLKEASQKIVNVARERIQKELMKILAAKNTADNLNYMEKKFSLLSILISEINELKIIGQCQYHREDVWTHSLYAIKKIEELLQEDFWNKRIEKNNIALLKFATLFHDIGKIITEEVIKGEIHFYGHDKEGAEYIKSILKELCFSKKQIFYIIRLIKYHMRPLSLYYADNLTEKGKYRFFKDVAPWVTDTCLLAAADTLSTKLLNNRKKEIRDNLDFLKELVRQHEQVEKRTTEPLLDGYDIMKILSINEGPKVGEILEEIKAAQAQGKIANRREAIKYLHNIAESLC